MAAPLPAGSPSPKWRVDREWAESLPHSYPTGLVGGKHIEFLKAPVKDGHVSSVKQSKSMNTHSDVEKKMSCCSYCSKPDPSNCMMKCSQCRLAHYCDKKCQRADWTLRHKADCCKPPVIEETEEEKEASARRLALFMQEIDKRGLFVEEITTVNEIDLNLSVIRAGCRITTKKTDEERMLKEMSVCGASSPFNIKHNHVAVQPSPVHGVGVFATKPLPPNVIVTVYPCHAIHNNETTALVVYPLDDGLDLSVNDANILEIVNAYKFQICPEKHLCVVGNPLRRDNPLLLGHLLNDGASDVFAGVSALRLNKNKELARSLIMQYLTESSAKRNCHYVPNASRTVLSIVTTRAIEEGEELFATYSPMYWLQNHYGHDCAQKYPLLNKAYEELTVEIMNVMNSQGSL